MVRVLGRFRGGLILKHYPTPQDIGLSDAKMLAIYRAFIEPGTAASG